MSKVKFTLLVILVFIGAMLAGLLFREFTNVETPKITNFEECAQAGFPIMESYPRQCRSLDGRNFIEDIGNELRKLDLIRIDSPRPNQLISSPVIIRGQARGYWFFEGDFPVRIEDEYGRVLGVVPAQAQADWMSEEFVPFRAELRFSPPFTNKGVLILEKDNPSGLPENADALFVPVLFQ